MAPGRLQPTQDPHVFIEERREGFVRYRNTETGRRWEVHGECVGLAHCIVGATLPEGEYVATLERAKEVWAEGRERFPDCPVTPEFKGCCRFDFVEL